MRIYFGTVVRNAPAHRGGELVCLDWDAKRILARTPIVPSEPHFDNDPNPRGNTRGCKGIVLDGERVIAADYHTLRFYDRDLRLLERRSHGLMVGLHELALDGRRLWVSSTAIDGALAYDLESGRLVDSLWPREQEAFQRELGLEPLVFDKTADQRTRFLEGDHMHSASHLHLNAVAPWKGSVLALFNAFGVVANLSTGEILIRDSEIRKGHNLALRDDGIAAVSGTHGPSVRFYDLETRRLVQSVELGRFGWVRSLRRLAVATNVVKRALRATGLSRSSIAKPLFVRGLALHGDRAFVGVSPASILEIDWRRQELVDAFRFSRDVHVCVHGLAVDADRS